MSDIEGFILVGGRSSRMGRDKAALVLAEQSFVERIQSALAEITVRTSLVGARESYTQGLRNVPDVFTEWGALGGLHAALAGCEADWAAVVACDLPFVTAELFRRLATLRARWDAVVPIQEDGRQQPLCALYSTEICRPRAEELIRLGERRPRPLLDAVRTRRVAFNELEDLRGAKLFFMNINTPEDYEQAKRRDEG
ncbi:MAG TPA: molybdenum cofactor guanylyltransferase [Pyrinomonadaceae bacterium]|nr:molybdenum cofactor guanylyltransferase [Pyrinomonadaceae bacterium]